MTIPPWQPEPQPEPRPDRETPHGDPPRPAAGDARSWPPAVPGPGAPPSGRPFVPAPAGPPDARPPGPTGSTGSAAFGGPAAPAMSAAFAGPTGSTGSAVPPARPAARTKRLLARTLDYTLTTALVLPLWFLAWNHLQAKAADLPSKALRNALFDVIAGRAGDAAKAPLETVDGLWGTTKTLLLLLVLAHLLVPVLYDWLMHAYAGRTLGKALFGVKVVPAVSAAPSGPVTADAAGGGGARVGLWRTARRTVVAVLVPWAALLLAWYQLMLREWGTAGLFALVSLLGLFGPMAALGPRRRALHDRAGGTVVVDVRMLARSWEITRQAGGTALGATRQAGGAALGGMRDVGGSLRSRWNARRGTDGD